MGGKKNGKKDRDRLIIEEKEETIYGICKYNCMYYTVESAVCLFELWRQHFKLRYYSITYSNTQKLVTMYI